MRGLPLITIAAVFGLYFIILGSNNSDSPHGKNLKFGCDECHSTTGWTLSPDRTFEHSKTDFTLTGQHIDANCKYCHPTLIFEEAGTECNDCHADMHEESVGLNCERCHSTHSWLVTNIFEIHLMSRFPLVGPHSTADCQDCHRSGSLLSFEPVGILCSDCHLQDYVATEFPDHEAAGYSTSCEECHSLYSYEWSVNDVNHNFFPLTGGHDISDCFECHKSQDYSATSPECISCHESDYLATTNPNHTSAGFSTNCLECHTFNPDWTPATFDHNLFFQLTGVHTIEDCERCHVPGNYSAASSECYSCHAADYNSTTNPAHMAAGFSTDCAACHSTQTGWVPATFNHDQFFPLTGVHNINDCSQCHTSGNYSDASSACYSCHEADYNATADPNHALSGFSTECQSCHTTASGWVPSTFDHDSYFPIYSGKHRDEWNSCTDCHTNASNYSIFSCTDCHEHNKTETDNDHSEVGGYVYESSACLNCHPGGEN